MPITSPQLLNVINGMKKLTPEQRRRALDREIIRRAEIKRAKDGRDAIQGVSPADGPDPGHSPLVIGSMTGESGFGAK